MKSLFITILIISLISCHNTETQHIKLTEKISNLEAQLKATYHPGLGEMMGSVQKHHSKLWFAANNANWKLATFEIKELHENIEDIKIHQAKREETQWIDMIIPSLDSTAMAIKTKNFPAFKAAYNRLTKSCNDCHLTTHYEYIRIKTPDHSPYYDQDFNPLIRGK
jgi:hypothetical protein